MHVHVHYCYYLTCGPYIYILMECPASGVEVEVRMLRVK
jgi:hypothetical protein